MFGRMMSQKKADVTPGPLGGMLGEVSCNSPGALRSNRSKKSNRGNASSPYRRSNRIITKLTSTTSLATSAFENDGDALLTPGRDSSTMFVADKHVGIRKSSGPHGLTLKNEAHTGIVVSGINRSAQAALNGMLVGDVISAVDGIPVERATEALRLLDDAPEHGSLTITATGTSRALVLDKAQGDLGMTCSSAPHVTRGVLLKRIAKGSLADKGALYPGDTIISVNETLVYSHQQAVGLMNAAQGEVRLVMWGQSREISIGKRMDGPLGLALCNHELPTDGPGVRVFTVEHDSRCVKAGLSAGDTLLSINGVLATDHVQALSLIEHVNHDEEVFVVFQDKYVR